MSISQNFPTIEPSLNLSFALTKVLDPRITFSRPTDAVYYDGKTVSLAEQNLVLRSQEFDAYWAKDAITVTANTTVAPDGTTTADTIAFSDTVGLTRIYQNFTANGLALTFSVFVKYIDKQWIAFRLVDSGGTGRYVWFDIQNGVVGTTQAGITASIVASANGFYRCIATIATTIIGNNAVINGVDGDGSTSNVGQTGSIAAWGAQLEQRDTVTAYTPTTTQRITNYVPTLLTAPSNVARFDHNPVTGESLGLLVEEQRTNLFLQSETFGSSWSKTRCSITANTVVAPDGTLTGDKLVEDTTAINSHVAGQVGGITGVVSALSVYAKAAERQFITILHGGISIFDLSNGVVSFVGAGNTPSITDVGDGWYRCTVVGTAPSTSYIGTALTGTSYLYTGDGYSGVYIWGAQLEAGAFPTSYIKTVASQVTRAADSASMTGTNFSDWYRADEGSVFVEAFGKASGYNIHSINNGADSNAIRLNNSTTSQFAVTYQGVSQVNLDAGNPSFITFDKYASAYKVNDFALSLNGNPVVIDISGNIPLGTKFDIGNQNNSIYPLNGYIRKLSYYPQRLTNTQLQALTS